MAFRRPSILNLLLLVPVGYLLFCVVLYFVQDRLVFFPTHDTAEALDREAALMGFEPWRNARGERIGWQSATGDPRHVLLIFNGNGGHALMRAYYREYASQAGDWQVFLLEYPGYGARAGRPSEKSLTAAALEAFDTLAAVPDRKITLLGESLGSGVAAAVAARRPDRVAGLVMITPYDRLFRVGQGHYPWLPVTLLMRTRFDSVGNLEKYAGPMAVVLAGADTVVPPSRGQKLYESYQGRKRLWTVPDVNHDVSGFLDGGGWREVVQWLQDGNS